MHYYIRSTYFLHTIASDKDILSKTFDLFTVSGESGWEMGGVLAKHGFLDIGLLYDVVCIYVS